MKVVTLPPKVHNTDDALAVLDDLRAKVLSGEVICFVTVAVGPDDGIAAWISSTRPFTRLRMVGAVAYLHHHVVSGDV